MRVAGYARVSTQEQKLHGVSIEAQESALENWAKENGHFYLGTYNDAGISARSRYTKRPELLRLLYDVKACRVDLIIFTKLDRWFRNVAGYYEVQKVLDDNGVAWKAIWEDYETETASGRLKVNIMLSVAQDESDRTSERIRKVNEYRRASGEIVQPIPVGYKKDGKVIVIDEAAKPGVSAVFSTYLDTGSSAKAQSAARSYGICRSANGIRWILKNPFYCGETDGVKYPAYITRSTHERILRMLSSHCRATKQNRVHLFSGLLICGNCGARLRAHYCNGSTQYTCSRYVQRSGCSMELTGYITERRLEKWLLENLDSEMEIQIRLHTKQKAKKKQPNKSALEAQLDRLKILFISGDIDLEEFRSRKTDIDSDLEACAAQPVPDIERLQQLLPAGWREIYQSLSREGRKSFWRRTLDSVIIQKGKTPKITFVR